MTIKEVHIGGPILANMEQALCFTCWSAGKVLYQVNHGYEGSEPITQKERTQAGIAARIHEVQKEKDHKITIFHMENTKDEYSDHLVGGGTRGKIPHTTSL